MKLVAAHYITKGNCMEISGSKGNNPELWEKLLECLNEKLQLGLLGKLRQVNSYHFEDKTLFLEPGSAEDEKYLRKDAVFQQLRIFAQDLCNISDVVIRTPSSP